VEVKRVAARHVMGNDRPMHMHRALGHSGGAAGEVQQSEIFRVRRRNLEPLVGLFHQMMEALRIGNRANFVWRADQEHMPESGQRRAQLGNFTLVKRGCRDEHASVADAQPLANRLGAERREQRTKDVAAFECSERADIKLGDRPVSMKTRSPALMPRRLRTLAKRFVCARRSA